MREIEFAELRGDPAAESDQVTLAGRCYQGPMRVGDVFTEAESAGERHEVALAVASVLFYGKAVTELDPMSSAEITLTGQGVEGVTAGVVLRGRAE